MELLGGVTFFVVGLVVEYYLHVWDKFIDLVKKVL